MYNGTVCSYAGDLHRDAQTQALYPPCALRVAAVVTDTGARRALLCGGGAGGEKLPTPAPGLHCFGVGGGGLHKLQTQAPGAHCCQGRGGAVAVAAKRA